MKRLSIALLFLASVAHADGSDMQPFPDAQAFPGAADIIGDATMLPMSDGGSGANLTASNGGVFYSTSSAGAILSGTANPNRALLSGSSTAPAWAGNDWPLYSRLAADPTGITSTTPASTTLSVTVLASTTYLVMAHIMFTDSTAVDGYRFDFDGGAATVTDMRVDCTIREAAATANTQVFETTALATDVTLALASTAASSMDCIGTITFNAGGTFIVRAAQNAHSTGTLTLRRGSSIRLENIP